MFRKTKIKLVSLYTIIFFIILCLLSLSLFLYMSRSTYRPIDDKLNDKAAAVSKNHGKVIAEENEEEPERPIIYLFWGQNKQLIGGYPKNAFSPEDLKKFFQLRNEKKHSNITLKDRNYRILSLQPKSIILKKQRVIQIQLVYNIDPEVRILKNLLLIIGFGCAVGLLLSFLAGLFLANKALVPIQRSWEKQTQFVADASHELRTPLAVIQTHLELLFRHPARTIEEESEIIFTSLSEVKRINKLVAELLTLARSDSNEQQIQQNHFWMDELLQLIVEQMKPIAKLKDIVIEETIENHLNYIGDQERFHQLFIILLDNALKFTPSKGKVFISCKKEGNHLRIVIKDTGIGIPEKDLPYIFDRFFRGDKSRSRSEGGTGLGLSIAKWIVEAHHGQIGVDSKLNEGTAFIIKLPASKSTLN